MRRIVAVSALVGATLVSGCSVSSSSDSSNSKTASSDDAVAKAAQVKLDGWIKGTQSDLPTGGPQAQPGKNVWVISCGQQAGECETWSNEAMKVGKLLGWKMTLFDTKLNPAAGNAGIQNAVTAHADGVIVIGNSCPQNRQGLSAAKAAGVAVVAISEQDCNDPAFGAGGPSLLTELQYTSEYPTLDDYNKSRGTLQADYLLANLGKDSNVVEFKSTDILTMQQRGEAFEQEYKKLCPSCKLKVVEFSLNDTLNGQLKTNAQQALASDPKIKGVVSPTDAFMPIIGPVVDGSGRRKELLVIGNGGLAANIDAARAGRWQDAGAGGPNRWESWAAIDSLNRTFAGAAQTATGIGTRLWSVRPDEVNLPPQGQDYSPDVNYEGNYKKNWGLQ
jgi:ribose transport system substrate-binding protein